MISWEYYENSFNLLLSDFTHVEKYRTAPYTQADRLTPPPRTPHMQTPIPHGQTQGQQKMPGCSGLKRHG